MAVPNTLDKYWDEWNSLAESIQNSVVLIYRRNSYRARKVKKIEETVSSFSFKSFQLLISNTFSHFLYFRFTSRTLTSLIMPVGITGKSGPSIG